MYSLLEIVSIEYKLYKLNAVSGSLAMASLFASPLFKCTTG